MSDNETLQYLLGKLEALELLTSGLAVLSPATAGLLLAQCQALHEKADRGEALVPFEQGLLSVEQPVLAALKAARDAEKIRSVSGPAQH